MALSFSSMASLTLAVNSILGGIIQIVSPTHQLSFSETCQQISNAVSTASTVYYPGSQEYEKDISHWLVSSAQFSMCSFEPGTVEDVGVALQILGRKRTPFAVKGGGHSTNPGFSSSPGVQIAMSRFSEVIYDPSTETVKIGAGQIWDEVYAALEPYGRNVVGGRLPGVGVAGYTLGGGYSWLTNQYGLTIDNVHAFELVTPNGTVINVTASSSPDLFFALRGGGNNFGIVTRFTLKTYPQTHVWGGTLVYGTRYLDRVMKATANFAANNDDPKAAIIMVFNHLEEPFGVLWFFYDAPRKPVGVFDDFLAIPCMGEPSVQPFSVFVKSLAPKVEDDNAQWVGISSKGYSNGCKYTSRGIFATVSTTSISESLLKTLANQSYHWRERLGGSVPVISFSVQPFLPTLFEHNTSPSAYPPDRAQGFLPLSFYFGWRSSEVDEISYDAIRTNTQVIKEHIAHLENLEDGQKNATLAVYPNYAIFDTPLVDMYGANIPRLRAIHAEVDPQNVMGLAGGFKF